MWDSVVKILIGMVGGFLLAHLARRPKLKLEGHGSGNHRVEGRNLTITEANIYNDPSFFGLKVNREPAQIINALILDPELKQFVGPTLVWQKGDPKDGVKQLEPEHTIGSGLMGRLFLFAKDPFDENFFIYRATALDAAPESSWPKYKQLQKSLPSNCLT